MFAYCKLMLRVSSCEPELQHFGDATFYILLRHLEPHDFLIVPMLCRLRDNQRKLYLIISMQPPSSILLLADQSWVLLLMSSLSPKTISKLTLKTITRLLEWYWTLPICDCHALGFNLRILLLLREYDRVSSSGK